jgi:mono/diheme cytochrome c family protein
MQKVNLRRLSSILSVITLASMLTFSTTVFGQDAPAEAAAVAAPNGGDAAAGEKLFKANCAACHKLYKKATGPALYGVGDKYEEEWLYKWIKNSAEFIASGDARAIAIWEEYNKSPMNAFPGLSNTDIDNIIAYTYTEKSVPAVVAVASEGGNGGDGSGISNNIILGVLTLVFLLLMTMLFLVTKTLNKIAIANGVEVPEKQQIKPIWKAFVENQFLLVVTAIIALLGSAYFIYGGLMSVGVEQGYAPVQPIHYSHRIHAGSNEIDCNYCHSSARKSKHSGIPSLNVCMNCHKSIGEVAEGVQAEGLAEFGVDYNKEIQKLYKAVGWDEENQKYTGETEPVKWVRIHNLPDFAYFNHSQHVTVAGVDCQKCHGPVEEMEIMYQYSPLTMGWCINCHRETNIQVKDNGYYEKIHEELSKKYGVEQLTAAQMGGLECGKCHY